MTCHLQVVRERGGLWFTFISDHNLHDELQDDLMLATEPRYRQESAAATLESVGAVGDTTNQ